MWRILAGVGLVLWGVSQLIGADSPLMPWLAVALGLFVLHSGGGHDAPHHSG